VNRHQDIGVRAARPHTGVTADGRRVREVLTYSRRGSRMGERQSAAWESYHERWWIPDAAVDEPGFDLADRFGREAPLIVEIGSGVGEATVALAAARPSYDVLAFEVWRPGVADTLHRMARAGVTNIRLMSVDAVW
jgi:tRNA (guanine-N7-)-methyltransferase